MQNNTEMGVEAEKHLCMKINVGILERTDKLERVYQWVNGCMCKTEVTNTLFSWTIYRTRIRSWGDTLKSGPFFGRLAGRMKCVNDVHVHEDPFVDEIFPSNLE